jgi:hypothetical protein
MLKAIPIPNSIEKHHEGVSDSALRLICFHKSLPIQDARAISLAPVISVAAVTGIRGALKCNLI